MKHVKGPDLPTGGGDHLAARGSARSSTTTASAASRRAPPGRSRTATSSSPRFPYQVSPTKRAGADRRADARQEAADGRGPARRVGSREPDAPGASCRAPTASISIELMDAPVRDHRSGAQLPRQSQHHRARWPAAGDGSQGDAERVAGVPHRDGHAPPQHRLDKVDRAAAHPRRPADRLPQSRRGDPHHPPRGRAEAGADEALQALGRAGRGDPRDRAAPPGEARGDEDPRGAEDARRGARGARGAARRARRS